MDEAQLAAKTFPYSWLRLPAADLRQDAAATNFVPAADLRQEKSGGILGADQARCNSDLTIPSASPLSITSFPTGR